MNMPGSVRRHWRVVAVALLGAVLAFACSFLVSPTYEASTRLIVHGRDAGFLSSVGQTQSNGTSITDSTQASALADTYSSVATSRSLATAVVDQLKLDRKPQGSGVIHALKAAGSWVYRCVGAFVTSGYCASVDPRQKAIADVQNGTAAQQLGTDVGATAGHPGAYVLEITASGESGAQAQAIANSVADQLVRKSQDLVKGNADAYIKRLQTQLDQARKDVTTKAGAVTSFESVHNISAADQQEVVTATSYDNLRAELNAAQADLADSQAQLDSINAALSQTPETLSTSQQINTGRSGTTVSTDQVNPAYTDLQNQQSTTTAKISGLQARIPILQNQVSVGSPTQLSGPLADLAALQADLTAAQNNRDTVATSLSQAQAQAATAAPDLSRLDAAGRPDYPTSPKRYLYLLIGLLLGALAGGGLTWLARRRTPETAGDPGRGVESGTEGFYSVDLENELLSGHVNGGPPRPREGSAPVGVLDGAPVPAAAGEAVSDGEAPVIGPNTPSGT